jgi:predicted MFS family arabinose efflux permease
MKLKGKNIVVFIVLAAAVALAYQLPYLRYNFYQQMIEGLGLNDMQIGLIGSAVNLVNTICYPIGGYIADRFKTRTLIVTTFGAFTLLSLWFAFAHGFIQLFIIHVLFAFFGIATLWSAYLTAVRGLADEKSQSKVFGWNEGTRGIIQFLTSLVIVALMAVAANASSDPALAGALGFRYVMLFAAALCGIFTVLSLVFMDKGSAPEVSGTKDVDTVVDGDTKKYTMGDVLKNPGVWLVTFLIMCAYLFWTVGNSYLTQYTVDVLGLDAATASTIGTVRTYLIVAIAGFLGGILLDKFPYKGRSFVVLLAIDVVLVVLVMLTGSSLALCVAITICVAFIANIMKTTYWSTMGEAGIPAGMTALATGVISFICFMPDWIYPTVFGNWLGTARAAADPTAALSAVYHRIFIILIVFGLIGIVLAFVHWKRAVKLEAEGVITIDHHDK